MAPILPEEESRIRAEQHIKIDETLKQIKKWGLRLAVILFALLIGCVALALGLNLASQYFSPALSVTLVEKPTPTQPVEAAAALAEEYYRAGKYTEAIAEYHRLINADPRNSDHYVQLARVYIDARQYAEAMESIESALLLDPHNPTSHALRGVVYYHQQEFEPAAQELEFAILGETADSGTAQIPRPADEEMAEYYLVYGAVLTRLDRCAEAIQIFELLIVSFPEDQAVIGKANQGIQSCQP